MLGTNFLNPKPTLPNPLERGKPFDLGTVQGYRVANGKREDRN
ncbi:hypothetical protein MCELHM10_02379 [Paracoccaceae bacterium]|jgi:hypothetical protein